LPRITEKSSNRKRKTKRKASTYTPLRIIIIIIIIIIITMASPARLQLPAEFVCPITKQLMKEPVISRYGHHFERSAVLQHIESGNPFCPLTGIPLCPSDLIPNNTLQWKIKFWAQTNGLDTSAETGDGSEKGHVPTKVGFVTAPAPHSRFHCPLTRDIMKDPVMTKDGINFERDAIVKWLCSSTEGYCPVTSKPLSRRDLVPNSMLQREIEQWELRYGNVLSSPLMLSTGSELSPQDTIRTLPMDLYSGDSNKRIKYLRRNKKSLMDVLDSAIEISNS
jgi:hypothetical protein